MGGGARGVFTVAALCAAGLGAGSSERAAHAIPLQASSKTTEIRARFSTFAQPQVAFRVRVRLGWLELPVGTSVSSIFSLTKFPQSSLADMYGTDAGS